MRSSTITLSTQQQLGVPELLNNYLFIDPVYGLDINFPLTANGGLFTDSNISYVNTEDGEFFFPWGYIISTNTQFITADTFKGPYTITFSPSGIDTQYYSILKMIYDFGDGEIQALEHGVITGSLSGGLLDPASIDIQHNYWPVNGKTTYSPSITVLNGNLSVDIINYELNFVPASIFEFEDFHLINTAHHTYSNEETFGVFEVKGTHQATNARFFSAGDTDYNSNVDLTLASVSGLILNLDASITSSIIKDSYNYVNRWYDNTSNNNDFIQETQEFRPQLIYPTQTTTDRKAVRFTGDGTVGQYLTCINTSLFDSVASGYTAFYVLQTNDVSGTVFFGGVTNTGGANLVFEFSPINAVTFIQGTSGTDFQNLSLILPSYSIYTFTVYGQGDMKFTADTLSINRSDISLTFDPSVYFTSIGVPFSASIDGFPVIPLSNTEISQILLYNRVLSVDEFKKVQASLYNKWSITPQTD